MLNHAIFLWVICCSSRFLDFEGFKCLLQCITCSPDLSTECQAFHEWQTLSLAPLLCNQLSGLEVE